MPFDGSGNYAPAASPNFPAIGGTVISAAYYNNVINDIATALSNTLTRDGQGKPSADINWNGKSLTNVNNIGATSATITSATITNLVTNGGIAIPSTTGVRCTTADGFIDISGGSAFTTNGASIALRGNAAASNPFGMEFYAGGSEKARLDTNGGFYVGSTGGEYSLTWKGIFRKDQNADTNLGIINANTGASATSRLIHITGTTNSFTHKALYDNAGSPYYLNEHGPALLSERWAFNGSEVMRITNGGLLGIGQTSPVYRVDVGGAGDIVRLLSSTVDAGLRLTDSTGSVRLGTRSSNFTIDIAGSERLRLDPDGNFNVGTLGGDFGQIRRATFRKDQDAITQIAVINGTAGASAVSQITKIGGTGGSYVNWALHDASGAPYDQFEYGFPVGSARWIFNYMEKMRISAFGDLTIANNGAFNGTSLTLNSSKWSVQHDGSNAYVKANVGSLNLGANGANYFQIDTTGKLLEVASGYEMGYKDLPQNAQAGGYTLVMADRGKHVYCTGGAANVVIPPNSSVAFPIGTACTIINDGSGARTLTQGAGVTLKWAGLGTTGNRTLAVGGVATLIKVATDTWYVSGAGLS